MMILKCDDKISTFYSGNKFVAIGQIAGIDPCGKDRRERSTCDSSDQLGSSESSTWQDVRLNVPCSGNMCACGAVRNWVTARK